jgi:NAD/NADP transhydrogenase beta subunit
MLTPYSCTTQVWKSEQVVFFKRSMASGYAGVDNPVFYNENTDMCLGNAADTLVDIFAGIKDHAEYKEE